MIKNSKTKKFLSLLTAASLSLSSAFSIIPAFSVGADDIEVEAPVSKWKPNLTGATNEAPTGRNYIQNADGKMLGIITGSSTTEEYTTAFSIEGDKLTYYNDRSNGMPLNIVTGGDGWSEEGGFTPVDGKFYKITFTAETTEGAPAEFAFSPLGTGVSSPLATPDEGNNFSYSFEWPNGADPIGVHGTPVIGMGLPKDSTAIFSNFEIFQVACEDCGKLDCECPCIACGQFPCVCCLNIDHGTGGIIDAPFADDSEEYVSVVTNGNAQSGSSKIRTRLEVDLLDLIKDTCITPDMIYGVEVDIEGPSGHSRNLELFVRARTPDSEEALEFYSPQIRRASTPPDDALWISNSKKNTIRYMNIYERFVEAEVEARKGDSSKIKSPAPFVNVSSIDELASFKLIINPTNEDCFAVTAVRLLGKPNAELCTEANCNANPSLHSGTFSDKAPVRCGGWCLEPFSLGEAVFDGPVPTEKASPFNTEGTWNAFAVNSLRPLDCDCVCDDPTCEVCSGKTDCEECGLKCCAKCQGETLCDDTDCTICYPVPELRHTFTVSGLNGTGTEENNDNIVTTVVSGDEAPAESAINPALIKAVTFNYNLPNSTCDGVECEDKCAQAVIQYTDNNWVNKEFCYAKSQSVTFDLSEATFDYLKVVVPNWSENYADGTCDIDIIDENGNVLELGQQEIIACGKCGFKCCEVCKGEFLCGDKECEICYPVISDCNDCGLKCCETCKGETLCEDEECETCYPEDCNECGLKCCEICKGETLCEDEECETCYPEDCNECGLKCCETCKGETLCEDKTCTTCYPDKTSCETHENSVCPYCDACRGCREDKAETGACDCFVLGNVTGSGKIVIDDALEILMFLAEMEASVLYGDDVDARALRAARITNPDGKIVINDALEVLMFLAKMDASKLNDTIDGKTIMVDG